MWLVHLTLSAFYQIKCDMFQGKHKFYLLSPFYYAHGQNACLSKVSKIP